MATRITAYIANHNADAGDVLNAMGEPIGTYHVARRYVQRPGGYALIHATIDGIEHHGMKFSRSRKGQVTLSRDPFGHAICDCAQRNAHEDDA